MESELDEVQAAIERAGTEVPEALQRRFADVAQAVLRGVDERARQRLGAGPLAAIVRDVFEFTQERRPGEVRARVTSSPERGRTAIAVLQDDRPFIVDTMRLLFQRLDLRERLFTHPIFDIRRLPDGSPGSGSEAPRIRESLVYAEVTPRLEREERLAALQAETLRTMDALARVTGDYRKMIREMRELEANIELAGRSIEGGPDRAGKICRFIDWLVSDHFVFQGFRRYAVEPKPGGPQVVPRPGSGLGLDREVAPAGVAPGERAARPSIFTADLSHDIEQRLDDPRLVFIEKAPEESIIHRRGKLDSILVKELDESGEAIGYAAIRGLFTFRAVRTPGSQIPLLAERLEQVMATSDAVRGSHRYKAMAAACDSMPVEFLLANDAASIGRTVERIVAVEGSDQANLVVAVDPSGQSFYAAVIVPRRLYREDLRVRVRQLLKDRTNATDVDDRATFIEEGTLLLHYFCTSRMGAVEIRDRDAIEREIRLLAASWGDTFADALCDRYGDVRGSELLWRYEDAFPEEHRHMTSPRDALRDVEAVERLARTGHVQSELYLAETLDGPTETVLKIYQPRARLLSELLPAIDHIGIRVIESMQTRLRPADRSEVVVDTLRVEPLGGTQEDLDAIGPRVGGALRAVFEGDVVEDELAGLVLLAGLDWREVDLLRSYVEYFNQIQGTLTRPFVRSVLLANPIAVRLLVRYHGARLAPDIAEGERAWREDEARERFEVYRDRIASLNEDRALGSIFNLIEATVRTTFFHPRPEEHRVAFKLESGRVAGLPPPVPYREIFVNTAAMMGLHLRGGPVARGGIRWSDRLDDVRTEVLGLMRTQMLKNGLIVPVGAKGGFVLKRTGLTPQEARAEADARYRSFIAGLLDLTDSVEPDGRVRHPAGLICRDGEDPYLVVAADKGTAHLSDAANEIAQGRGFWLGDAFASGGSEGYDHKEYGITARGAWECVRRHFLEMGVDPGRDPVRAAGIGDMSGDVFGNGMLLSRSLRLVAAFNHLHIFVDPDPDPEASWQERKRLFEMPRSSWTDYDRGRISDGGGVYERSAKAVPLSHRAREMLGLGEARVTGAQVIRAILRMEVDLLWNGGIGTYVKASWEDHTKVGDRANDAVRVDGRDLRARVVGEGGNLGITQSGRVEAAIAGVRLNTDAIDNSGGVDLSDHEVNLKALLAPLVRTGRLDSQTRRSALFGAAEEACERVLSHNRAQALALSLDERRSAQNPLLFLRAIEYLERAAGLDPSLEGLPIGETLVARREAERGLLRPELAVLLGFAKNEAQAALQESELPDDPYFEGLYRGYFPESLASKFEDALPHHRLRREITALAMTNRAIDAAGVSLVPTLVTELGIGPARAVATTLFAEDVIDAPRCREDLIALEHPSRTESIYTRLLELDRAVRRVVRLLVLSRRDHPDRTAVERWRAGLQELRELGPALRSEDDRIQQEERRAGLAEEGIPEELACQLDRVPFVDRDLNLLRIRESTNAPLPSVVRCATLLAERTGLQWVYQKLPSARRTDAWDAVLLANLRTELLELQRLLTLAVLIDAAQDPATDVERFVGSHAATLERVQSLQRLAGPTPSATALGVVVQSLKRLVPFA